MKGHPDTLAALHPGKDPVAIVQEAGRPHGRSGQVRKISPPPGFDPRTVQPVASRYTDYATRAAVGTKAFIYLDDIVIWGATLEGHNQRLVEVSDRLRVQALKLEPDKCEFVRREVYFWGLQLTV